MEKIFSADALKNPEIYRIQFRAEYGLRRILATIPEIPNAKEWNKAVADVRAAMANANLGDDEFDDPEKVIVSKGLFNADPIEDEDLFIDYEVRGTAEDWGVIYLSRFAVATKAEIMLFLASFVKKDWETADLVIPEYEIMKNWDSNQWKKRKEEVKEYFKKYYGMGCFNNTSWRSDFF